MSLVFMLPLNPQLCQTIHGIAVIFLQFSPSPSIFGLIQLLNWTGAGGNNAKSSVYTVVLELCNLIK